MNKNSSQLYGVKMRASLDGEHISGAERIVEKNRIEATLDALVKRAFSHERGEADSVNLKIERQENIIRINALKVVEEKASTVQEGWLVIENVLASSGINRIPEIRELFKETYSMRGAMLLDADTLERLEPDKERGVRATFMDSTPSPNAAIKDHFTEAITLASKALSAPNIIAEICVSDDPDYTTGYIAANGIYHRINPLKEKGDKAGGRIFLYRGKREDAAETIRYLEKQCVIVTTSSRDCIKKDYYGEFSDALEKYNQAGLTRKIRIWKSEERCIANFSSNDYLNLASEPRIKEAAAKATFEYGAGTGASRLVTGTQPPHKLLEEHIARFKGTDDAIVYSTGYMANLGAISTLVGKGDFIVSDELNHASIVDGARLSRAEICIYPHRDMQSLERILSTLPSSGKVLVVSDGVFSMDGDILDLPRFIELCEKYNALSYVDEAHSIGVVGNTGHGLKEFFSCRAPDIQMGTLSKALGSAGGYIAGRKELIEYLRQKSRPFIFNTAPSAANMASADMALTILENEPDKVRALKAKISLFVNALGLEENKALGQSAIIPILIGDERKALEISHSLEEQGFLVPAIRYPSVAKGSARLRAAINLSLDDEILKRVAEAIKEALKL